MKIEFLKNIETLEDLKQQYKKLAMKFHPDRGGDLESMKQINNEYDFLFSKVKNTHKNSKGESFTKVEEQETPDEFKDLIDELLKIKNIEIEIIGSFVWLSGETKQAKDKLKELGFKWSPKKKMWYKAPSNYRKKAKKNFKIEEIRNMYGSQKVRKEKEENQKQLIR